MRAEIELLRDARPDADGPTPEVAEQARAALMAEIAGARRTPRWPRRRLLRIAAPAVAAAAAAAVLAFTLTDRGAEPAWAAALVRVAEAAPRLLVDDGDWEITRADLFSVDSGEMTFASNRTSLSGVGGMGLATFLIGDVTSFRRYVSPNTDARERQWRHFY